jgi:hypothetical protein
LSLQGIWKSRGYGWILKLDPEGYALFDYTSLACIEIERGSANDFTAGFEVHDQSGADHLALSIRHELSRYEFDRIAALPPGTLFLESPRQTGVLENFDCFCEVFRQDYAFFDLRGVDWDEVCAAGRRDLDPAGPDGLFPVLQSLITPLKDNHVMLSDGIRTVNSEKIAGIKALVKAELALHSASIGDPYNVRRISAFINEEFLGGSGKVAGNDVVIWGKIAPDVGYLNVIKLFGLNPTELAKTATDLPPRRPDHARFLHDDLEAIEDIMDRVLSDLGECTSIIVDVRINGGGFDKVGMAIANRFADRRRLAFTKHARDGAGVTPSQAFHIEPGGDYRFTRPVYLLTSSRTASAGDIFALCMRGLPHVTLVGQPSTGILSDNLKKQLPNGWTTSISNEFYCSADGKLFEGPGIPVDIESPVFKKDDFRAGYHLAVDKALELARGHRQAAGGP